MQQCSKMQCSRRLIGLVGIEDASETQGGARKRNKTTTSFTEADKNDTIEFLMRNEVLYSKRLAGFRRKSSGQHKL